MSGDFSPLLLVMSLGCEIETCIINRGLAFDC